MKSKTKKEIKETVRRFYGKNPADKKYTSKCCCRLSVKPHLKTYEHFEYSLDDITKYYQGQNVGLSFGNPIPPADIKENEIVLDLGSGYGLDCFLAAKKTGQGGRVIGIDMTPESIEKARSNMKKQKLANVEFRLGEIENIPAEDRSIDVVISNCVINLSPDKQKVFDEIFRVLKPGGRLAAADIIAEKEIPDSIKNDEIMYCSCIGGAATKEELEYWLKNTGYENISIETIEDSRNFIKNWLTDKFAAGYVISAIIKSKKPESGGKEKIL